MKQTDIKFIFKLSMLMDHVSNYLVTMLDNINSKEIFSMLSEESLDVKRHQFEEYQFALNDFVEDDNMELIDAIEDFYQALYFVNSNPDILESDDVETRKKKIFERKEMRKAAGNLLLKMEIYTNQKKINYERNISSLTTEIDLEASLLFFNSEVLLAFLRDASNYNIDYFESCRMQIEDCMMNISYVDKYKETKYLVRNKDGKLLKYINDGVTFYVCVKDKKFIERFDDVKYSEDPVDKNAVVVDKKELTDWRLGIERKIKEDKKEVKKVVEPKKKEVKEKKVKKKKHFNLFKSIRGWFCSIGSFFKSLGKSLKRGVRNIADGVLDVFGDLTVGDIVLGILPVLVMVTYLILLLTGVMDQITFSSNFNGTLFGYDFELSGLFADWLENTDHGFFSAITLGLIQVILIVIGFVLDLVIHLLFLVLALVWVLIIFIFSMCFYYVFPVAIAIWLIVNCFRVDSDKKVLAVTCMLIGVICCALYFLIGMNVI